MSAIIIAHNVGCFSAICDKGSECNNCVCHIGKLDKLKYQIHVVLKWCTMQIKHSEIISFTFFRIAYFYVGSYFKISKIIVAAC